MSSLFLSVLPLALGAAVSPTLLTLELLILAGRNHPLSRAWAFAIGASAVLIGYAVVGLAFLQRLPDAGSGSPSLASAIIKIAAGLALALLGVRQLLHHPAPGEAKQGRLQQRMATSGPLVYVGIGALGMLTNVSTLVLLFPAMHTISNSSAPDSEKLWVAAAVVAIALTLVLVPVLAVSLLGSRAHTVLDAMNRFTTGHKRQINAGIAFIFAVWLIGSGGAAVLATW